MNRSFEIPTVGRAWLVLLGAVEAWFCRGATGYLLGPYESPARAARALIHDLKLVLEHSHGNGGSLPQADEFGQCNEWSFYADGTPANEEDPFLGWDVPLRNGPVQTMLLLTDSRGLVPGVRFADWEDARARMPRLRATGMSRQ